MRRTAIAAHRGGALLWPENSLRAFRGAVALPVEQVECDVHASADGVPIVMHDTTFDRTTLGAGAVCTYPSEEIARMRLKGASGETVPSLADMLAVLSGTAAAPRIEIKADPAGRRYPGLVCSVLRVLEATKMRHRAWVISFDLATVAEAAAAGGLAGVCWLLDAASWRKHGIRGAIALARRHNIPEIGLDAAALDAGTCAAFQGSGMGVAVWGANDEPAIRRMLGIGVDVLTTDDPHLAMQLRG